MRRIISLTLALPLLTIAIPASMSACSTTRMAGEQSDDARIKGRVGRRLAADPEVERFDIDVDVLDGVVTLRGEVDDRRSAEEAVRIAQHTEGVKQVVDQLQIEVDDDDGDGDLGIRASVGTKLLADPDVRRVNIDVDVINGVVYLSGVVHDDEAKAAAERIATNVDGVIRVENELTVSPADEPVSTDTVEQGQPGGEQSPPSK